MRANIIELTFAARKIYHAVKVVDELWIRERYCCIGDRSVGDEIKLRKLCQADGLLLYQRMLCIEIEKCLQRGNWDDGPIYIFDFVLERFKLVDIKKIQKITLPSR